MQNAWLRPGVFVWLLMFGEIFPIRRIQLTIFLRSRRFLCIKRAKRANSQCPTKRTLMKTLAVCLLLALCAVSSSAAVAVASDDDTVAAITKLENDAVKADMANDSSFYEKLLADGWTGGTSRGTFDTKESFLADLKDPKNKMKSEKVSDIKVRSYGDAAVATYTNTYDAMMKGKHYARTVVYTDVFQKQGGDWKEIANHCSMGVK